VPQGVFRVGSPQANPITFGVIPLANFYSENRLFD
jgi:hypothetical protein